MHKWTGAFCSYQRHHTGEIGEVPIYVPEAVEETGFMKWLRRHRPDLVIGHVDDVVVWLTRAGRSVPEEAAFFSQSWTERKRPCAGLDLRLEMQGEVDAEKLIAAIQRGEREGDLRPRAPSW